MTSRQYAKAIEQLGLSQVKAGEFLGVTGRQSRRYISGETPVPEGFARLLRLMIQRNIRFDEVT